MSDGTVTRAVAALLIRDDGKVLAVETDKFGIGFPCGKVKPGESEHGALAREVQEETGMLVTGVVEHLGDDAQRAFICRHYLVDFAGPAEPVAGGDVRRAWWADPEVFAGSPFPLLYPMARRLVAERFDRFGEAQRLFREYHRALLAYRRAVSAAEARARGVDGPKSSVALAIDLVSSKADLQAKEDVLTTHMLGEWMASWRSG